MIDSATLAPIRALGRQYDVGFDTEVDDLLAQGDYVVSASALTDASSQAVSQIVEDQASMRAIPADRYAASITFQRYCHRIAKMGVAAMLTGVRGLDLSAKSVHVVVSQGATGRVLIASDPQNPTTNDAELFTQATHDNLALVAQAMHERWGTSYRNLWGNIAAGWAGAARHLSIQLPAEQIRERIEPLLVSDPMTASGGVFRILVTDAGITRLFYDRTTCCQLYRARSGKYCSWCSHLSERERTERYLGGAGGHE